MYKTTITQINQSRQLYLFDTVFDFFDYKITIYYLLLILKNVKTIGD